MKGTLKKGDVVEGDVDNDIHRRRSCQGYGTSRKRADERDIEEGGRMKGTSRKGDVEEEDLD